MPDAVDKREWLVSQGLAKPGRGKFSLRAHEALAEAEKNGVVFLDKGAVVSTVKTVAENGDIVEVKREINPFAHHPEPIREGYYLFVGEGKQKARTEVKVSVSEICTTCRYSVAWCYCETPTFRYWRTGETLTMQGPAKR